MDRLAVRVTTLRPHDEVRAAATRAARTSYGRLLALLAAPTRDIPLAEDALADAFERALRTWPVHGIPDRPDAWLLTVARNRQRDLLGSAAHRTSVALDPEAPVMAVLGSIDIDALDAIPDKRLELLFVCAHPAIDPAVRTPLMLHIVLGVESAAVARAFAVAPSTMAQRLVRAKRRIRDAGIPFVVPGRSDMPARLTAVLEAIYGAYAVSWNATKEDGPEGDLSGEALYLAVTLARLLRDEPEAYGLAALIALASARADARVADGRWVPLSEQDPTRWDPELIAFGERLLRTAHAHRPPHDEGRVEPGRFQIEAAIQSAHAVRLRGEQPDPDVLLRLHRALVKVAPTLGARTALAAAAGDAIGPEAGLAELDSLAAETPATGAFGPFWATRAHLLAETGRPAEAVTAYDRAIETADGDDVGAWLSRRRAVILPTAGRTDAL